MFNRQAFTRYETILDRSVLPRSHATVLAGTSRALRLTYKPRSQVEEVVAEVAVGLVAPMAFLFVWWALCLACKQKVQRIYFLARDGEIFFKIAKVLVNTWHLDIEVRYLYCSRESLLVPSFDKVGLFEKNWIIWGYQGNISIGKICARLGLTLQDLAPLLADTELGWYVLHPEEQIPKDMMGCLQALLEKPYFEGLVKEQIRPQFDATLQYLTQEGLTDKVPMALLDTGWTGSSQYAIGAILRKTGHPIGSLTGYYLGVNREAWSQVGDRLEGFLFDWRHSWRDERLYNFICYELLFSGLHGRTRGYRVNVAGVEPILVDGLQGFPLETSKLHHRMAEDYARRVAGLLGFDGFFSQNSARLGRKLMREFICSPSSDIACVYGDWPMASEICESDMQGVAPSMDFRQFLCNAFGKTKIKGYWPQASLQRGGLVSVLRAYNFFLRIGLLEWYRRLLLRY